ncbi:MAG: diaminopimelate epimerase [Planctomycetota bacterium]
MNFTKMHGAGNDYVYVDCFNHPAPNDPSRVAIAVSDRHTGIGGDGLILIEPSDSADARMRMFNADGSEAEMCGNGVRCVAKYVFDHGICRNQRLHIETGRGILALDVESKNGKVEQVKVNMGEPILLAKEIPTTLGNDPELDPVVDLPIIIEGREIRCTCVSMGNPHCVIFVDEATDEWVHGVGPMIENHSHFPQRVNVEFVEIISPTEVRQRTWERGSGETLACGTGASAVCVAGVLTGRTERTITNHLLGGTLILHWDKETNHVFKKGPATEVFSGVWEDDQVAVVSS